MTTSLGLCVAATETENIKSLVDLNPTVGLTLRSGVI